MQAVRPAAVAGLFYPARAAELAGEVARLLDGSQDASPPLPANALIVPPAGYVYSGPVAASASAFRKPTREQTKRVVLLGPAHRVALSGVTLPGARAFATPLGTVELDRAAIERARDFPIVADLPAAHEREHALEVQLPFLQSLFDEFTLVPLLVGSADAQAVAALIDALWGEQDTVIVVSSDLSHYLDYAGARLIDAKTAADITALRAGLRADEACGATPVNALLHVAKRRLMQARLLDLRNSGDAAGDKSRVVGYGAFAFASPPV